VRRLTFQTLHDVALMLDRERAGREASTSAGVLDSQSVKAPAADNLLRHVDATPVGRRTHSLYHASLACDPKRPVSAVQRLNPCTSRHLHAIRAR
jgi:hypothetical protein